MPPVLPVGAVHGAVHSASPADPVMLFIGVVVAVVCVVSLVSLYRPKHLEGRAGAGGGGGGQW